MKKFILFLIPLFSFIFITNVGAISSDYNISFKYDETFYEDTILYNKNKIDNLIDYLEVVNCFSYSGYSTCLSNGNTLIELGNLDTTTWRVILRYGNNINSYWDSGSSTPGRFYYNSYNTTGLQYDVSFSNDDVSYFTFYGIGSSFDYTYKQPNALSEDVIAYIDDRYFITNFVNNTYSSQFISYACNTCTDVPIKITNTDDIYYPNDFIPTKEFFDSFVPVVVPDKCLPVTSLGQLNNVSSFDVSVTGSANVLSGILEGAFSIYSGQPMNSTDWNITFTHNEDELSYFTGSFTCNNNVCIYRYQAWTEDDINVDFDLNFHFEPVSPFTIPDNIYLYTCYDNNNIYMNTTYTYTNNSSNIDSNVSTPSLDNFLQDGSLPDISGLSNTSIMPDGPVDAILTLPLNIMNSLLNVLNTNTCQPLVLPIPFSGGQNLTLPCISTLYAKIDGFDVFLNWFSAIISAFILYEYFINLYKWVDNTLTFRENNHFGGY